MDDISAGTRVSLEVFKKRAKNASLVPVWKDCLLDTDTPVSAFAKLRRGPFAFLLESAPAGGETWSRYTYLGSEPRGAWRLLNGVVEDWTADRGWHNARTPADPLADLSALIDGAQPADVPELGDFWGGVVGYFSYDVVRLIENLPHRPPRGLKTPDALFVFTRSLVILDNLYRPGAGGHLGAGPQGIGRCGAEIALRERHQRARGHPGASEGAGPSRIHLAGLQRSSRRGCLELRARRFHGARRADQGIHPRR